jgi:hypothetical protein
MIDLHNQDHVWWWKGLWKIKRPLKAHIFMWCLIKNKIPTWDRIKIWKIEGSGWCPLCKGDEDFGVHMFLLCPFVRKIWEEFLQVLGQMCRWKGNSVEESWKDWLAQPMNRNIKNLPLILNRGVWMARNADIFCDKSSLPEPLVIQGLIILENFPQEK